MWENLADGIAIYQGDFRQSGVASQDHIITDPPYEDELHVAAKRQRIARIRNDGGPVPDRLDFDGINADRGDFARNMVHLCNGWLLLFTLAEGVRAWRDDLQSAKAKWDTTLAWVKPDSSPRFNGQGAARGFECIISAWCGQGYRSWNGGGKRGVYTHIVNGPSRHGLHPTEKPLSLMCELIRDFTQPGDTIFDPFMGSGTTGLACIRLGRKFVGCEISPRYYTVAKSRLSEALDQTDLFTPIPQRLRQGKLL
jgi:site-specific DNA-methyltransferase (adenine-specific)